MLHSRLCMPQFRKINKLKILKEARQAKQTQDAKYATTYNYRHKKPGSHRRLGRDRYRHRRLRI